MPAITTADSDGGACETKHAPPSFWFSVSGAHANFPVILGYIRPAVKDKTYPWVKHALFSRITLILEIHIACWKVGAYVVDSSGMDSL